MSRFPKGWNKVLVGDVCDTTSGGTPSRAKASYWGGAIPWVTTSSVDYGEIKIADEFITEEGLQNSAARVMPAGTLLMAMYGQGKTRGRVGYLGIDAAFNQACLAIIPGNRVQRPFLYYFFQHNYENVRRLAHGSNQDNLSAELIRSIPIGIPPLEEQRRIVAVLSTWDRGIEEAERLLALKEQRKRALMQQLLTGKRRFPEFKARWRNFSMSDLFEPVYRTATGEVDAVLSISSRKGFERQEKKYSKVIAGKNLENYILLQRGEFAYNKGNSKTYPQGCIFRLDDYAEAAVPNVYFNFCIKDPAATNSDFFRSYFEAGLLNMGLRGLINTGIRNNGLLNIYEPDFYALTVRCPDLTEQRRIAAVLNACDAELRHLRANVDALKQQRKGLMQKLLTGQVRVPESVGGQK